MSTTKEVIAALTLLDPEGTSFIEMDHDILYLPFGPRPEKLDPAVLDISPEDDDDDEDFTDPDDPYAGKHVSLIDQHGGAHWSREHDCWVMY